MSAWSRLRAWLKSSTPPGVPADWQQQLAEVSALGRFDDVLRLVDGWHFQRPGTDQQFAEWLRQAVDGCSCSASRVVVIHDRGTYCGDGQFEQLVAAAVDALDTTEDTVDAVLTALRGPDPERDIEITDLDAW